MPSSVDLKSTTYQVDTSLLINPSPRNKRKVEIVCNANQLKELNSDLAQELNLARDRISVMEKLLSDSAERENLLKKMNDLSHIQITNLSKTVEIYHNLFEVLTIEIQENGNSSDKSKNQGNQSAVTHNNLFAYRGSSPTRRLAINTQHNSDQIDQVPEQVMSPFQL